MHDNVITIIILCRNKLIHLKYNFSTVLRQIHKVLFASLILLKMYVKWSVSFLMVTQI